MKNLEATLARFALEHSVNRKGGLSLVLIITRHAGKRKPPYVSEDFLTPQGGQVSGLSSKAVQNVLGDHGISRILAKEAGRTSRGNMQRMKAYLDLLNNLHKEGVLDFARIEKWWVERVREYFATKPLKMKIDPSKSLRSIVGDLVEAAFARQKESKGTMVAGAVLQHLVGAKLEIALPKATVEHHGFSVADASTARKGDFLVGDAAIHVTTAPTEALIRKCSENLADNLRPIIVTSESGAGGAAALAKDANVAERIDILEIEQFVATNVYEWGSFEQGQRPVSVRELIEVYNRIVDKCETDPNLKILIG